MKKKHWILGLLVLGGISLLSFTSAKTEQAKEVLENLRIRLGGIKFKDIVATKVRLYIDIVLENPTPQNFTLATGKMLVGKSWLLKKGNEQIGGGSLNNFDHIELNAGGKYVISDLPVEIDLLNLGEGVLKDLGLGDNVLSAGWNLVSGKGNFKNVDWKKFIEKYMSDLNYVIYLEGFGQLFTFKGKLI